MSRALRVLQLAPLYQPLRTDMTYGSIERLVMLLDKGLTAGGDHSVTLALRGSQTCGELVRVSGSLNYAEQARLALEVAARTAVDVVQVHRREFFDLGAAREIKAAFPLVKVVATLHGPPDRVRQYYPRHSALAHFVFVSAAQAGGLPELQGTVVRNAVDVGSVPFRGTAAQPPYLCVLGRISEEKGVAEAIELAERAGLPLKIAGVVQDRDRPYFETAVAPRLRRGWVEFLGPLTDGVKYDLLGASTALVLLANYADPCPLVALEALAAGTPVLGLARGGLPELVEDGVTGMIAADPGGLCSRLPGLVALNRRWCRQAVAPAFDLPRMVRDYLAVYRGTSQPSSASVR